MFVRSEEFSFRSREKSLQRFRDEVFDLLVIGGGITGAAVARDAVSRGLKVALVERKDFAFGTSSRSSKLIHGGLRYLQNLEIGLVFEALAERSLLLKAVPHMVRPLIFYLPVYEGDPHGRAIVSLGLWAYDILALFRAPGFHRSLSSSKMRKDIPFLKTEGLKGGFKYYDASMWDDALAVETVRAAYQAGAAVANYVEAVEPIWQENQIKGFKIRDMEKADGELSLYAHRTVVCAGPWTDEVGGKLSKNWHPWLNPSKGVHIIFDLKRIPVPGAMVMSHPEDGRIAFVIPRPDYGAGVVIVGTTDGPTPANPERAEISPDDIQYLMKLLTRYFPDLNLTTSDILSAYVGVRPLMGEGQDLAGSEGQIAGGESAMALQKVSREHHIDRGPGGTVVVAGGKYTTHRRMAQEIVDFTLKTWREDDRKNGNSTLPAQIGRSKTKAPVNPLATRKAVEECLQEAAQEQLKVPEELISRYGAEALNILDIEKNIQQRSGKKSSSDQLSHDNINLSYSNINEDPAGFPYLLSQLRNSIRNEMTLHLEDFYLRRVPLYATRKDHGLPWAKALAQVWAEERGYSTEQAQAELERLKREIAKRSEWQQGFL